jgi:hypothetical protein
MEIIARAFYFESSSPAINFFFSSSIQAFIRSRIPPSVQSLRAFSSLSISALIVATSPRESMTSPRFFAVICTDLTAGGLYPTDSLDNGRIVNGEQNRAVKPHHFPPYLAQILPQE